MNKIRSLYNTSNKYYIAQHKVLKNTYLMLSITLLISSFFAFISSSFNCPNPGLLPTLLGSYGLMLLTYKLANKPEGLIALISFTSFMGYSLGPLLNNFLYYNSSILIALTLFTTAMIFILCSIYVMNTKVDLSFLSGILISGFVIIFITMLANAFFDIKLIHLVVSSLFILFSSASILWEINNIIKGGETNYIRATLSLYVSLYNIFVSMLNIFNIFNKNE